MLLLEEVIYMEQKLKKVIADLFDIKEDEINDNLSIENVETWDSLKHIELMFSIEEEFEIPQLSMDEIVEMTSIAEIKRILRIKEIRI